MNHQQQYFDPDRDNYPQVSYGSSPVSSSPPKRPQSYSDLEAVSNHNRINTPGRPINEKDDGRRICGFRRATFWLSLALILVIIIAAIGGGVGGALGSSNSSNKSSSGGHATTKTVTAGTATGTAPPTSSSSTPSQGISRLYCTNGTTYTSTTGAKFKEYCSTDWAGGSDAVGGGEVRDIVLKTKGSYEACMDACAEYNKKFPNSQQCKAVGYNADLTLVIPLYGANCWLKSAPGLATTLDGIETKEIYAVAALE